MYALMHTAHLSARCLQTFSEPLVAHTSLQFALYQTTRRGIRDEMQSFKSTRD